MPRVYIGLGSNQGDAIANLREALKLMEGINGLRIIAVSSLYLTEPLGHSDQPWFHNCVAAIDTELSPGQLLKKLQQIENTLGRVRTVRWGPRTIDLDILLYNELRLDSENLTIPHPRMAERAFVMVPLAEIAGQALFPDGRTAAEVRNSVGNKQKYICIPQKIW